MRHFILIVGILIAPFAKANDLTEAELVTKRFAHALNDFDTEAMADEMHSDALEFFKRFAIHIASTPANENDQKDFFTAFGVTGIEQLKALEPKVATIRFYKFAFGQLRQEIKATAEAASIRIIGALQDEDGIYVLYRTDLSIRSIEAAVPSVILLRTENGKMKVLNTTQMEGVKAKAYSNGLPRANPAVDTNGG